MISEYMIRRWLILPNKRSRIAIVTSIATTPSYMQSGYAPAAVGPISLTFRELSIQKAYEKQYDDENSLEGMAPLPPPPPIPVDIPE